MHKIDVKQIERFLEQIKEIKTVWIKEECENGKQCEWLMNEDKNDGKRQKKKTMAENI